MLSVVPLVWFKICSYYERTYLPWSFRFHEITSSSQNTDKRGKVKYA